MTTTQTSSMQGESVAFLDRTYDEALELTRAARDYIAGQGTDDKTQLDPDTRLAASCEEMRLTARMTQVMAWLMVQRAVHAGEMTRAEAAAEDNRLGGQDACLGGPTVAEAILPPRLVEFLDHSHALYERVRRLDLTLDATGES